jgi:hypothetical protein
MNCTHELERAYAENTREKHRKRRAECDSAECIAGRQRVTAEERADTPDDREDRQTAYHTQM